MRDNVFPYANCNCCVIKISVLHKVPEVTQEESSVYVLDYIQTCKVPVFPLVHSVSLVHIPYLRDFELIPF